MKDRQGLVAFDLDGTLVPNTTVCIHLAPWVGHDELADLERLYAEGAITNAEVAERDATFYANRLRRDVWAELERLPLINGLTETMEWMRERGVLPVIATVTWRFAAEFVQQRHGFAAASGCEMDETEDGVLLGTVSRHFEAEDKVTFVREYARSVGLGMGEVVAVGDSTSDIPLFRETGLAIALNASRNARAAADVQLDTDDLRDLIPVIDRYYSSLQHPPTRLKPRRRLRHRAGGV